MFRDLYLYYGDEVQIGTGNDPSDIHSGITTIHGFIYYEPYDVYVDTNDMWFAVIGANSYSILRLDVEIISIDLSSECLIDFSSKISMESQALSIEAVITGVR